MKIYVASDYFVESIRRLFHRHTVNILPEKYEGVQADLLVFTGGSDINPEHYGMHPPKGTRFNDERDAREFKVMSDVLKSRNFTVNKVLGICRGHQLISVATGGSLIYDIASQYGSQHDFSHDLTWHIQSSLAEFLPRVNSIHHQGTVSGLLGGRIRCKILATEPTTRVIEAALWGDSILGVQFHPELMPESTREKFQNTITDWVSGKTSLNGNPMPVLHEPKSVKVSLGGYTARYISTSSTSPSEGDE